MTLTDHIRRIEELAGQTLVHVQEENFGKAAANVMGISNHCNDAMQQLDEISLLAYQGKGPAGETSGGP